MYINSQIQHNHTRWWWWRWRWWMYCSNNSMGDNV